MQNENNVSGFLSNAIGSLREGGFQFLENISCPPYTFLWVARQARFAITKFGFSETFFVFAHLDNPDITALRTFSTICFKYAKQNKRIALPCGFFESVWCFPVAIVDEISPETAELVRNVPPKKHWASGEIPVVFDAKSGTLHSFEKTPVWGAAYYAGFRKTIERYLAK